MMKSYLKIAGIGMIGLVIGLAFGIWITGRGYERFVIDPLRFEKAGVTAYQVQNLSLLRIGATEEAIKGMETMLDTQTQVLTSATHDPSQLPGEVIRALKQVKAYRALYPAEGPAAASIETALARIPDLTDYKKECQAGLCRLLESKQPANQPAPDASTIVH